MLSINFVTQSPPEESNRQFYRIMKPLSSLLGEVTACLEAIPSLPLLGRRMVSVQLRSPQLNSPLQKSKATPHPVLQF